MIWEDGRHGDDVDTGGANAMHDDRQDATRKEQIIIEAEEPEGLLIPNILFLEEFFSRYAKIFPGLFRVAESVEWQSAVHRGQEMDSVDRR